MVNRKDRGLTLCLGGTLFKSQVLLTILTGSFLNISTHILGQFNILNNINSVNLIYLQCNQQHWVMDNISVK